MRDGAGSAGESEESSSEEDDYLCEDIVTVEDGAELEFQLTRKPIHGRKKRRYSEVIPGRVMLSGLVSMRKDCINSDLGIVCSNHSDINGKDAMEDRQFSLSSVNEAMDLGDKAPAMAFWWYDGHSGEDCAEYIRLNLHAHVFSDIPALLSTLKLCSNALSWSTIFCHDGEF